MKIYPYLYSRTSTGAVHIWRLEQDGGRYRSSSGQLNGQITTTDWTICEAKNTGKKNATSPEQQAVKEIEAQYKKKLKEKYHKSQDDIDEVKYFKPMLAKSFSDYKDSIDWASGVFVQNKYNGMRCIAQKDGLFTRKGERIVSVPHIWESIKHIFLENPEATFDGELYNHQYRQQLNELVKLCRKTVHITADDLRESERIVRYYAYDGCVEPSDLSREYTARHLKIHDVLSETPYYHAVMTWKVFSEEEMRKIYDKLVSEGNEGVILRLPNAKYENKRTKNLLKYKPVDSDEFEIVSIEEGEGDWSGKAKRIGFKMSSGEIFYGAFKGNMEQASEVLKNKNEWIGKTVTAYFNGYTGLGVPQFCQFDINQWDAGDR